MTKKSKSSKKSTKTSKIKVTDNELKLYDVICAYRNELLNIGTDLTNLAAHIHDAANQDYRIVLRRPESAKTFLLGLKARIEGLRDANACYMTDAIAHVGHPLATALGAAWGAREHANSPEVLNEKCHKEWLIKEAKKYGLKLCECSESKPECKVTK